MTNVTKATFETLNTKDMWKDIVQVIIDHRKKITKRTFSSMDGIYTIRYDFSDADSVTTTSVVPEFSSEQIPL